MKGGPAVPGSPMTSKPTWWKTRRDLRHVGFFVRRQTGQDSTRWTCPIGRRRSESPKRPAPFEEQRTGHLPQSVTVVLREDTLVITLKGVLSQAEKALAEFAGPARRGAGVSSTVVCRRLRLAAAGDQKHHGGRRVQRDHRSRDDERHDGVCVPVGPLCARGFLEREPTLRSVMKMARPFWCCHVGWSRAPPTNMRIVA